MGSDVEANNSYTTVTESFKTDFDMGFSFVTLSVSRCGSAVSVEVSQSGSNIMTSARTEEKIRDSHNST